MSAGDARAAAFGAPVAEVTLLEDRAHVVRRGRIALEPGRVRLTVAEVAPVIADKTLRVRVAGDDAGVRVVDARVRRRLVDRALEASAAGEVSGEATATQLADELRRLEAQIEREADALGALGRRVAATAQIAALTVAELSQDAAWGRAVDAAWHERIDGLSAEERRLREALAADGRRLEERRSERERLRARLDTLRTPAEEVRADLEIDVEVDRAGEHELCCEYVVPGACWRPQHTARLRSGSDPRVEIATDACVWQNTGEDWTSATLRFSTERPSLGAEPPSLSSDVLRTRRKSAAVVVETREQEIQTTGLGGGAPRASSELPGIDDGGQPLELSSATPATVPSDGRPYRVRLLSFESEASLSLVAKPELVAAALHRTEQENRGAAPLLAGPVDLIRDSGFVGRTSVLYVAPGERFELGWGPEPDLRVARELEVAPDESRALSSWTSRAHTVTLRLSNIGPEPRRLRITERVPVSEIEKVKIEDTRATGGGQGPDKDGFVHWDCELPPRGRAVLELRYVLRKHDDVKGL